MPRQINVRKDNFLWLANNCETVITHVKGTSKKYKTEIGTFNYRMADLINPKCLGIISHVRSRASKMDFPTDPGNASYVGFPYVENLTVDTEVWEIDVRRAYLVIAYKLGLVSKKMYDKYYQSSNEDMKTAYCMAIGSLASKTRVYKYNPEKGINEHIDTYDPININAYKTVTYILDSHMKKIMSEYRYNTLFYWVDAIFLKGSSLLAGEIQKSFSEIGFETKRIRLKKIAKIGRKIVVLGQDNKKRVFNIKR